MYAICIQLWLEKVSHPTFSSAKCHSVIPFVAFFFIENKTFCVFLQGKAKQTEIANQIKLSIKVQKSKLWKFLRIWWCVSNWIFPSFLSTEERNKCKKNDGGEEEPFFRFCGRHVLASFFFFPYILKLKEFRQ